MAFARTSIPSSTRLSPKSGYWFYPVSQHSATTSGALGNGTLKVAAWILDGDVTLSAIAADISAAGDAGAAKFRPAIYADDGTYYPGALVVDGTQLAADAIAVPEAAINVTLAAGVYWIGGVVQGVTTTQPTVRTISGWFPRLPVAVSTAKPAAAGSLCGYQIAGITGALPSTFTAGGTGTANIPRILLKAA